MSGGSFNTPQINFLQKQKELREQQMQSSSAASSPSSPQSQSQNAPVYNADKPPIPPRGLPPPVPQRHISINNEATTVTLRHRTGNFRVIHDSLEFFFYIIFKLFHFSF